MYLQSEGGLRTQRGRCTECGKRWWFYLCSRGEPEPGTGKVEAKEKKKGVIAYAGTDSV